MLVFYQPLDHRVPGRTLSFAAMAFRFCRVSGTVPLSFDRFLVGGIFLREASLRFGQFRFRSQINPTPGRAQHPAVMRCPFEPGCRRERAADHVGDT